LRLNAVKTIASIRNFLIPSYSALNSLQKTQWWHLSFSPRRGARGLSKISFFSNILMHYYGKVGSL